LTASLIAGGAALLLAALATLPRLLLHRAQDRLARRTAAREGRELRLLTRADLVSGRYRRMPGVLALKTESLEFAGLYGDSMLLPTSRIQKIATGARLASGRTLFRAEVLRITRAQEVEVEFVLHPAAASAWRSHLGLWAAREREAQLDSPFVVPGKK
jgi:hypothetical protein